VLRWQTPLRPLVDVVLRGGVGPVGLASAASVLNSVGISVIYARVAGPAPYGTYQLTLTIAGVASVAAFGGAPNAALRAAAQGRQAARQLFRMRLPYTLGTAALLAAAAGAVALARPGPLAAALGAAALVLPLFTAGDVFPAQLIGARRFRDFLRFQVVLQATTLVAVCAAVLVAPESPWLAVLAIGGLTGLLQLRGLVTLPRADADPIDLSYARKITALSILMTIDVRFDILLVGFMLGTREAAFVAVARTLPTLGKRVWEILYQPYFVRVARAPEHEALRYARRLRWPLLGVLGSFAAVGAGLAPWLIPAVYGGSFGSVVPLSQLLLLAMVLTAAGYPEEVFFRAHGRFGRLTPLYIMLPLVSFATLPPLVVLLGIVGIGVEALLVAVVYLVAILVLARREVR
jgi:O-antigen/teichoic acid export membrane protein